MNGDCGGDLACDSGRCVNPCDLMPCGFHAECVVADGTAWCRCKSGYNEGPNGDCVSSKSYAFLCHFSVKLDIKIFKIKLL